MKINICLSLIFIPFILWSQVNSSIDFVIGIEYSYRTLNNTFQDSLHKSLFDFRNGETGKSNFRIGFNYNRKITERIWLKSGLRLSSIGYYDAKKTGLTWGSEFDTITGMYKKDPNLPHELQFAYDYWFLEIPIIARYEWNSNKLSPFLEFGLSPNIYLTTRTKEILGSDTKIIYQHYNDNFNTLNLSANFSIGLNYRLNEKFTLFGQTAFRYHFTPLADAPIKEYLYNFGIELGIRKGIN